MNALYKRNWLKKARVVLMRRASDPWESHCEGMINTILPEIKVPSHQGPDTETVLRGINIVTMAGTASHNLSHIHYAMVETNGSLSLEQIHDALWEEPRITFVRADNGLVALNSVVELMRDLGRPRSDLWEVAIWEDALAVNENEIYLVFQVHNEAITIPEIIDAIRAVTGVETDAMKSIEKTNHSLGITKEYFSHTKIDKLLHSYV
jgi:glyceraldehyde-3-phosphate dehydrogenase (NAD(P))